MVKLYNFSKLPDEPMRTLLLDAQRLSGAKGSVVVKVTRGGRNTRCYAKACRRVAQWFLSSRKTTKRGTARKGYVTTDGGYILMQPQRCVDPLTSAQRFFETAIHEFAHIHDYQHDLRSPFVKLA